MDLKTATRLCGRSWRIARIGALLFLGLACGLLATSLLNTSKAGASLRVALVAPTS